ncbi:putative ZDHHC-type palmitoyltransferase 6 [Hypsizygus marmoreus]|uniref:ZDHHC-type palmitoyltransferase 6 n=1 Tax=Hypsizygus marmoreus TaxID=39966 RepID=A0A369JQV6_HYPMA|nr:putative ZDHHC-type palmitoyltransferase 6 [Hypsizygus marmoreus]
MATPATLLTSLETAATSGSLPALQTLLSQYTSLPSRPVPNIYQHLLPLAISSGHSHLTSLLLSPAPPFQTTITPSLIASASAGPLSIFEAFLASGKFDINASTGHTGSALILSLSNPPLVSWLLAHGADPNLHMSGMRRALDLAVINSDPSVVRELIAHGVKVRGTNALKAAAYYGRIDMLEVLVGEGGADVDEVPDYPEMLDRERELGLGTALHEAVLGGQVDAVRWLIGKGARRDVKDSLGRTPLELAREKGAVEEVVKALEE